MASKPAEAPVLNTYQASLASALKEQGYTGFAGTVLKTEQKAVDALVEKYFTAGPGKGKKFSFEAPLTPVEIYQAISNEDAAKEMANDYKLLKLILKQYSTPEKVSESPNGFMAVVEEAAQALGENGKSYLNRILQEKRPKFNFKTAEKTAPSSTLEEKVGQTATVKLKDPAGQLYEAIVTVHGPKEYGVSLRPITAEERK